MYPNGICAVLRYWPSPLLKKIIGFLLVVIGFFIPMIIIIFSYVSMYRVLQSKVGVQPETTKPGTSTNDKESVRNAQARRNIMKTLIIVSACFIFCWSLNQTYYLLTNIGVLTLNISHPFNTASIFLVYINSCVNPFIYVIHYQQFRRGVGLLSQRIANALGIKLVTTNTNNTTNDTTKTTRVATTNHE